MILAPLLQLAHTHSHSAGLSLYFNTALLSHVLILVYVFKYHPVASSVCHSKCPKLWRHRCHSQPLNLADTAGIFPLMQTNTTDMCLEPPSLSCVVIKEQKQTKRKQNTTSLLFKSLPLWTDKKEVGKTAQITDGMVLAMCLFWIW